VHAVFIRRPTDIGDLVRATRQARGLNQQDLADRLGVSRWWVNEFEGGKPTARLDLVLRALNELQITLTAQTGDGPAEVAHTSLPPSSAINIDDIADRGLTPRPDSPRPARKRRRR
jgi:HTH-type transcriptional regulator/antitoxin HipB